MPDMLHITSYISYIYIYYILLLLHQFSVLFLLDIVGTALFLLSDQSAMINCETLLVDGGYCAS